MTNITKQTEMTNNKKTKKTISTAAGPSRSHLTPTFHPNRDYTLLQNTIELETTVHAIPTLFLLAATFHSNSMKHLAPIYYSSELCFNTSQLSTAQFLCLL